jgi:hypothetical protein
MQAVDDVVGEGEGGEPDQQDGAADQGAMEQKCPLVEVLFLGYLLPDRLHPRVWQVVWGRMSRLWTKS